MKYLLIAISVFMIVGGLGCAALSYYITPADIDKGAIEYVVDSGLSDGEEFTGYPNLIKAEKLQKSVDNAHTTVQLSLQQQAEKDNLDYSIHKDTALSNFKSAQQREELLFGEKGLLSLGLSMAGFGTFTGLLGLMRKRPGDVTQSEMEQALATATQRSVEELTTKERQMIQVVKGIQQFVATLNPTDKAKFKNVMNEYQDTDTQIAVAAAKKL